MSTKRKRAPRTNGLLPLRIGSFPDTDWMLQGACRTHPDVDFFPTDGAGVAVARRVCARCPVRVQCLDYALSEGVTHGVWGGTSDRERQKLRALKQTAS